jgi:mitogen-activated protein kinase organizer 1
VVLKDNSKVISAGTDKACVLWDVATGEEVRKFYGHTNRINTVALNQENSVLVSGSYDNTIKFWDIKSRDRKPIDSFTEFKDSVTKILIDGSLIYVSSVDGCVRCLDIRKG